MATVEERLHEIIAESLSVSVDDIKPDSSFIDDLDADSLDVVEMIMAMESEFSSDGNDLEISDEEAAVKAIGGEIFYTDDVTFSSSNLINKYGDLRSNEQDVFIKKIVEKNNFDKILLDAFQAAEDKSIEISNEK